MYLMHVYRAYTQTNKFTGVYVYHVYTGHKLCATSQLIYYVFMSEILSVGIRLKLDHNLSCRTSLNI